MEAAEARLEAVLERELDAALEAEEEEDDQGRRDMEGGGYAGGRLGPVGKCA